MEFSGRTSASQHKGDNWRDVVIENPIPAVQKVWMLDAQWTDCPVEIEDIVKAIWRYSELGNDDYLYSTTLDGLRNISGFESEKREFIPGTGWVEETVKVDTFPLVNYLEAKGVAEEERVIIHWWW